MLYAIAPLALALAAPQLDAPLTEPELHALCAVTADLPSTLAGREIDKVAWGATAERRASLWWKRLPEAIPCGGRKRRLRVGVVYLSEFSRSADGTLIGVGGGYFRGPLDAGTMRAFFQRKDGRWRRIGREVLSVS